MAQITRCAGYLTLPLLAKGNRVRHHGPMNVRHDADLAARILPGVDLTLWLQLVVTLLVVAVLGGVAVAAI